MQNSNSDWDFPLTDEELQSIDAAAADVFTAPSHSPPKKRRRLPASLFSFQHCSKTRFYSATATKSHRPHFQDVKFGGCIVYSKTVEEVERAAEELLNFVEAKKKDEEGQCILGLDIEWRPTFQRGVAPRKAAVMQICGDRNRCHVLHIIHSQIPKSLQCLLEDPSSLKVGVCIANDAAKVFQDYNVTINSLKDLSDLANQTLGGDPKKWSLSSLTEMLICRQLPKPGKIRLGNWEAEVLSKEQLHYAATDAYVSWYLYQALIKFPENTNSRSAERIGTPN